MGRPPHPPASDRIRVLTWIRSLPPSVQDSALVVVVLAAQFVNLRANAAVVPDDEGLRSVDALAHVVVAATTLPLLLRRRAPRVVLALALAGLVGFGAMQYDAQFTGYAALVALYSVVVYRGLRWGVIGGVFTVAAAWIAYTISGLPTSDAARALDVLIVATAVALGDGTRNRMAAARLHAERVQLLAEEHARRAEDAVTEERSRIARELHDLVAHAMSVVAVQAGMGHHVIDADPAQAKDALGTIERTSRQALTEMRRMLGILRGPTGAPVTGLAPQPGLERLAALVDEVRTSGVPVDLHVAGDPVTLEPGVDLSAYRIVQEALTNVMKHAGEAAVRVRVEYGPDSLRLGVEDDGRGLSTSPEGHSGLGLVGMRERAAVVGGRVDAGPRPGGGFRVVATLPYRAVERPMDAER